MLALAIPYARGGWFAWGRTGAKIKAKMAAKADFLACPPPQNTLGRGVLPQKIKFLLKLTFPA
jgi:hypothetical protein